MFNYTNSEQQFMRKIAYDAILSIFQKRKTTFRNIPKKLQEKRSCFVTLMKHGRLRGCIGSLLPTQPLYMAIRDHAQQAAFDDPRFPPLTEKELTDSTIEISVLTTPRTFSYQTHEELLHHLREHKPGVVLTLHTHQATFLPCVWDDIPDPIVFLQELSQKAGLPQDAWQQAVIALYEVDVIT